MKFLKEIRELYPECTVVVGVHSDETVASYKRKPIMTMEERVMSVKESGLADEIIEDAPIVETKEYYLKHDLNLVVHGHSEEEHHKYANFYQEAIGMGIFRRMNYHNEISTTELIKRVADRSKEFI